MSRKTGSTSLSNGTLSLRFMQRGAAQRIAATSAKVVDEAEWDIGPAARAAWGVTEAANPDSVAKLHPIHVTRDESYLPFVFDHRTPDAIDQQPSGNELQPARRRIFRKGTEVEHEAPPVEATGSSKEPEKSGMGAESDIKATGSPSPKKTQPKSISGLRNTNNAQVTNKPGIRRHRLEAFLKPPSSSATGFLKPAGVSAASSTNTKRPREDNIATPRGKIMKTG